MKILLGIGLVAILALGFFAYNGGSVGGPGDLDLRVESLTHGSFNCAATSTTGLTAESGRSWLHLTNLSNNIVSFRFATSTTSAVTIATINEGLTLHSQTSSNAVWDSNVSGVNVDGLSVLCVGAVTGTTVSYIEHR